MNNNYIITIGRSSGSGGKEIAEALAKKLGIPFYDKEIIEAAAENSGLHPELVEYHDENTKGNLLYYIGSMDPANHVPLNHKVFTAQFEAIQALAAKGPGVFLGRCADYALRDDPRLVSVFVHAPLEKRIEKTMALYGMDEKQARSFVNKTDKDRSKYYNFYTGRTWGENEHYHLSMDSSVVGRDTYLQIIEDFAKGKNA